MKTPTTFAALALSTTLLVSAVTATPMSIASVAREANAETLSTWAQGANTQPVAASQARVMSVIAAEAQAQGVPVDLALAVAKVESNFDTTALSHAGARGVMQILPATARDTFDVDADVLWDLTVNVHLGLSYLRSLYEQYDQDWTLALSHYNGGTITGRSPRPHSYTLDYLTKIDQWRMHFASVRPAGPFDSDTVAIAALRFSGPISIATNGERWSTVREREVDELRSRFRDSLRRLDVRRLDRR